MLRTALTVFALAVLVLLALPALGSVGLGYVYSDSMEPTLHVDDGFVLVPASDVEVGDIVTYEDQRTGELVTHRVVGREGAGYLTRGDANPSTDQAAGAPIVTDSDIRGTLLEVRGRLVVLPGLGLVATTIRSNVGVFFGGLAALTLAMAVRSHRRPADRPVLRAGEVVWPVVATTFLVTVAFVAIGPVSYQAPFVATESGVGASLPTDSEVVQELDISVVQSPIATLLVETEGGTIDNLGETTVPASALTPYARSASRQSVSLPVVGATAPMLSQRTYGVPLVVETPSQPGPLSVEITVYPYPATLPEQMLVALHRFHPLVAAVVTVGAGLLPFVFGYLLLFDSTVPLRTPRPGRTSLLRRWSR